MTAKKVADAEGSERWCYAAVIGFGKERELRVEVTTGADGPPPSPDEMMWAARAIYDIAQEMKVGKGVAGQVQ